MTGEAVPRLEQASALLARALLGDVDSIEAMTWAVRLIDSAARHWEIERQERQLLGLPL